MLDSTRQIIRQSLGDNVFDAFLSMYTNLTDVDDTVGDDIDSFISDVYNTDDYMYVVKAGVFNIIVKHVIDAFAMPFGIKINDELITPVSAGALISTLVSIGNDIELYHIISNMPLDITPKEKVCYVLAQYSYLQQTELYEIIEDASPNTISVFMGYNGKVSANVDMDEYKPCGMPIMNTLDDVIKVLKMQLNGPCPARELIVSALKSINKVDISMVIYDQLQEYLDTKITASDITYIMKEMEDYWNDSE